MSTSRGSNQMHMNGGIGQRNTGENTSMSTSRGSNQMHTTSGGSSQMHTSMGGGTANHSQMSMSGGANQLHQDTMQREYRQQQEHSAGGSVVSPPAYSAALQYSDSGTLSSHQGTLSAGHQYGGGSQYMMNSSHGSEDHMSGGLTVDTSFRSPSSAGSQPHSPPSPGTLQALRQQMAGATTPGSLTHTGQSSPSVYFGTSRRGSLTSLESGDVIQHTPRFVRDTSKYWYKPTITRDDAIMLLKDKPAGTFVVRDSNSFPGAFGLALKVSQVPPNVHTKGGDPLAELVRHFLIEPTSKGVRLKGCSNEPVFASLAALVYQHSITPLALPCKLTLPQSDVVDMVDGHHVEVPNSAAQLFAQGAACNVLYLNSVDIESLTGPQAIGKSIKETMEQNPRAKTTVVHFKVSTQGITLTDNKRKLFFRRHYAMNTVTHCGMDPEDRRWTEQFDDSAVPINAKLFGFVARKQGSSTENACHVFAELDPDQPASAIANFVAKVLSTYKKGSRS
eukprot:GHVU01087686.1.p1 GENE.GHVU01087686.1~~GHVU01087686.1.p1  ORF type:complete len:527 (-),score=50.04 GHVU01087686.1:1051-2565(-)